jgi:hypothetical protein
MKVASLKRIFFIVLSICLISFVEVIKLEKFLGLSKLKDNEIDNSAFEDELAEEDKYDESIKSRKPYRDYNSELEVDAEELVDKVRDDLTGEHISYKFD